MAHKSPFSGILTSFDAYIIPYQTEDMMYLSVREVH